MTKVLKFVCYGEVLWDVFPSHKKIGGAPLNVALRFNSLGNDVTMISSVGNDSDGKQLLDFIIKNGLNDKEIQVNNEFQTSCVKVILDDSGSASYTIEHPCAWDNIKLSKSSKTIVKQADAFVFGSLAARGEFSRNTLYKLIKTASFKVFDVNLRAPHYDMMIIKDFMNSANFIKFNDDELLEICDYYNFKSDAIEDKITFIAEQTHTKQICVTLGGKGAILFADNTFYKNCGYTIKVKDTVGAGDTFLSVIINSLLNNKTPQQSIDLACAAGALVASKDGANPIISMHDIIALMLK